MANFKRNSPRYAARAQAWYESRGKNKGGKTSIRRKLQGDKNGEANLLTEASSVHSDDAFDKAMLDVALCEAGMCPTGCRP